jgi:hypothetical protein
MQGRLVYIAGRKLNNRSVLDHYPKAHSPSTLNMGFFYVLTQACSSNGPNKSSGAALPDGLPPEKSIPLYIGRNPGSVRVLLMDW